MSCCQALLMSWCIRPKCWYWIPIAHRWFEMNWSKPDHYFWEESSSTSLCYLFIFSVPKKSRTVALATFALSVSYVDTSLTPWPGINMPAALSPAVGTAIAIDNHHLLTVAHCLEFDTVLRKYPTQNLKYRYSPLNANLI